MNSRTWRWFVGVCVIALLAGPLFTLAPSKARADGLATVFGAVKKLNKDGSGFQLKARKGTYAVTWSGDPAILVERAAVLANQLPSQRADDPTSAVGAIRIDGRAFVPANDLARLWAGDLSGAVRAFGTRLGKNDACDGNQSHDCGRSQRQSFECPHHFDLHFPRFRFKSATTAHPFFDLRQRSRASASADRTR